MGKTLGVWAFSNDSVIDLTSSMITITVNVERLKQGVITQTQLENISKIESGIIQISKIIEQEHHTK